MEEPRTTGGRILFAQNAILEARQRENRDDTLFVQLLNSEVGLIVLGLRFIYSIFPELAQGCQELQRKLVEVTEAQEFWERPSDEGGTS